MGTGAQQYLEGIILFTLHVAKPFGGFWFCSLAFVCSCICHVANMLMMLYYILPLILDMWYAAIIE